MSSCSGSVLPVSGLGMLALGLGLFGLGPAGPGLSAGGEGEGEVGGPGDGASSSGGAPGDGKGDGRGVSEVVLLAFPLDVPLAAAGGDEFVVVLVGSGLGDALMELLVRGSGLW